MDDNKLYSKARRAKTRKFYGSYTWKKIRRFQMLKEPLCESCQKMKRQTPATVCDHIDPLWSTWQEFVKGPFQSLCKECHQEKTFFDLSKMRKAELLKLIVWDG